MKPGPASICPRTSARGQRLPPALAVSARGQCRRLRVDVVLAQCGVTSRRAAPGHLCSWTPLTSPRACRLAQCVPVATCGKPPGAQVGEGVSQRATRRHAACPVWRRRVAVPRDTQSLSLSARPALLPRSPKYATQPCRALWPAVLAPTCRTRMCLQEVHATGQLSTCAWIPRAPGCRLSMLWPCGIILPRG